MESDSIEFQKLLTFIYSKRLSSTDNNLNGNGSQRIFNQISTGFI